MGGECGVVGVGCGVCVGWQVDVCEMGSDVFGIDCWIQFVCGGEVEGEGVVCCDVFIVQQVI